MSNKRIKITKDSIELFGDHDAEDIIKIQRHMREGSQQMEPIPPSEPKSSTLNTGHIGAMDRGPRSFGGKKGGPRWSKDELNLLYYCRMNSMSVEGTSSCLNRKFKTYRNVRAVAARWHRLQKEVNSGKFSPDTSKME